MNCSALKKQEAQRPGTQLTEMAADREETRFELSLCMLMVCLHCQYGHQGA
jgi:hypothetical protein